ncbi:chemotaxis protein CheW [Spirochaetia bacterium]|nr:chemotaxis protein CheW [Spirochaetia bacterium]GHU34972.1 chemotaxis protein CheW [Spirochaetia bacterium]
MVGTEHGMRIADQNQLVTFQLGEELYGVNIMDVKEIVRVQEIRAIPNAPMYVEGIFNLRSEIIPIINLHKRFHLSKVESTDEDDDLLSGFVILDIDGMKLGIIIDRVSRVVTIEREQVQPPPQMISGIGSEYIRGVVRQEKGYLIILDIRDLFDPKELQKLADINMKSPLAAAI